MGYMSGDRARFLLEISFGSLILTKLKGECCDRVSGSSRIYEFLEAKGFIPPILINRRDAETQRGRGGKRGRGKGERDFGR